MVTSNRTRVNVVVVFFNDTATTEIYTLSLHDALPISASDGDRLYVFFPEAGLIAYTVSGEHVWTREVGQIRNEHGIAADRKSTRLNSSHANISYAVFCLKKKNFNTRS